MGWSIDVYNNNLKLTAKCAKELFKKTQNDIWYDESEVTDENGYLTFNSDHMEHMDYMYSDEVQKVLLKHKINGEVTFLSADGDNRGQHWGYRFTDDVLTKLKGFVTFVPVTD